MNKRLQLIKYLVADFLAALAAWSTFILYWRLFMPDLPENINLPDLHKLYITGAFTVPFFWLFLYFLGGYYNDVIRKSRLLELWQTFGNIFIGSVILYLVTGIHKTSIIDLKSPLSPFLSLFSFQFVFTYIPRLIITTGTTHKVHSGKIGFNTILIGSNSRALEIWKEVTSQKRGNGNFFIGFVSVNKATRNVMEKYLPFLGKIEDIHNIIREKNVEEVIIAIEYTEHDMINMIINKLINVDVEIKAIPSLYDILTGRVRMSSILGTPLISVSHNPMPAWQQNTKAFLDRFIAAFALIITLPLSIFWQ